MTDFDNNPLQGQPTPEQQPEPQPQPAPQGQPMGPEAAAAPEAPVATPYNNQVPHLTLDPNEPDPFQGDPFHTPEPPHAPEPPQPEPAYQQPHYEQPSYNDPSYGAPQYGAPQYNTQYSRLNSLITSPSTQCRLLAICKKAVWQRAFLGDPAGHFGDPQLLPGLYHPGVIQLLVSLVGGIFTCGLATIAVAIWGFIEGVLLLSASPSRMYDGRGVILRD